jgi:hypothetical protein
MFNGIAKTPDNSELLVVDVMRGIQTYKRDQEGKLEKGELIELIHSADNIEYDAASDAYYIGSIAKPYETL